MLTRNRARQCMHSGQEMCRYSQNRTRAPRGGLVAAQTSCDAPYYSVIAFECPTCSKTCLPRTQTVYRTDAQMVSQCRFSYRFRYDFFFVLANVPTSVPDLTHSIVANP